MISSLTAQKYRIVIASIVILTASAILPQRSFGERRRTTKCDSSAANLRNI